jgi:NADH:ubiquinone oxidoreductase subunit 5 (subunit L)/multisubunit Na+/H+ antiporter MnhA subunit
MNFGSIAYADVFAKAGQFTVGAEIITLITVLLFVGAIGKSAQLPLYTWLPDAMAGPTPVSALIHAATMVTAGIYMIARNNVLYTLSPFTIGKRKYNRQVFIAANFTSIYTTYTVVSYKPYLLAYTQLHIRRI